MARKQIKIENGLGQNGSSLNGQLESIPFVNPATGEQFGQIQMTTAAQLTQARRELKAAATLWSAKSIQERVRIVRQFQALLLDNMDEITAVINQNSGKSRQDALTELFVTVDLINEACKKGPRWLAKERVSPGLQIFKRVYITREPYGTAAIISPWNFPLMLTIPPVVSALLAGNTVMVKPSEVTAATGALMESLFERVPELAPFVRFFHGDGRVGAAMVESKPDVIFLTGSVQTGKVVAQAAAKHLIPVVCELGGKDPMIVLNQADLKAAARWGVWGAFFNAGQSCTSIERIYVEKYVYNAFVDELITRAGELKIGVSTDINSLCDYGSFTSDKQPQIVEDHIEDALNKGAKIVLGGQREGMFMEPTILVDVDHTMKIMHEETFGPVVAVMRVDNETHAVQLANDSDMGLSASVWSNDLGQAKHVAAKLRVGSVNINDTMSHFGIPNAPFGGMKQSGYGRTHGKYELLQFTQQKAVVYGRPPFSLDIATILRQPGRYKLAAAIMRLAFGVTPHQRLQPIKEYLEENEIELQPEKISRWVAAIGLSAAVVTFMIGLVKVKSR